MLSLYRKFAMNAAGIKQPRGCILRNANFILTNAENLFGQEDKSIEEMLLAFDKIYSKESERIRFGDYA